MKEALDLGIIKPIYQLQKVIFFSDRVILESVANQTIYRTWIEDAYLIEMK